MAIRQVVKLGDDVLRKTSRPVDALNRRIITLLDDMAETMYAEDGVGLAAPQVGVLRRAICVDVGDENGLFPEDGFLQEQRQLLETLDAEYNDKATYAMQRCVQTMFAGEPAGVPRIGTREAILNATREGVKAAWEYAVKHAQICQFTIGDGADDRFAQQLVKRLGTRDAVSIETKRHTASGDVKRVTEEMPVVQSKLVMGFAIGTTPEERLAAKLMSVVLGGTPSSKLFMNVREKQSLCYYCAARHDTPKNVMFVQSGVETKDLDRTEEAILKELNDMKKGNITDDEILFAKLAMCNSYNAVADSAASMETWYLSGMLQGKLHTPEEYAERIMNITKDEIVSAAERVTLDTVYKLKGAAK